MVLRRRLTIADDAPYDLVSLWLPVELAEAAGLDQEAPLTASVRQLVQSATGRRFGHVAERLTARRPTAEESTQLGITESAPGLGCCRRCSTRRAVPRWWLSWSCRGSCTSLRTATLCDMT